MSANQGGVVSVQLHAQIAQNVSVDGYPLPYIKAHTDANDELMSLVLDDRFGIDTNAEEVDRWLPFLANAMAIAAGRTSHGANSNIRNSHGENLAGYPAMHVVGDAA